MSSLVSGVLNKVSTDTPTIQESEFDVLELSNQDNGETMSLTENFGSNTEALSNQA